MGLRRIALLIVIVCLVDVSPVLIDFRPDRFARERYMRSRMQMRSRRLGVDGGNFASPDFLALASEQGYPAEEHMVTTLDGYKLRLHRLPGSPSRPKAPGKPVVFLQHGVLSSSDTWILMGRNNDLAYMLADDGYDVWLGNVRGNTYSRSHTKLSPDFDPEFWDFSWHEIALYDMPAMIDYILKKTQQRSLTYIGHSMGTSISYVLLSTKPEYNEKFNLVISLAPVAFWYAPPGPFIKLITRNTGSIKNFLVNAKIQELFPLSAGSTQFARSFCRDGSMFQRVCLNFLYFTTGHNPKQMNSTALPHLFSFFPAGASTKTMEHYSQNMLTGHFRMFDYGPRKNYFKYKQREPPAYNLSQIVAPVALIYGKGDAIVSPGNPIELSKRLPNVITLEPIPDSNFSHMDFLFSRDIKTLLNKRIMQITEMVKHENAVR